MATIVEKFNSLSEFVEYANGEPAGEFSRNSRTIRRTRASWEGTQTYEEAVTLAHGWREGAEKFDALRVKYAPKGVKFRRETVMREAGPGGLSMGRYLAGHPQPYAVQRDTQQTRNSRGKIVTIEAGLFVSAGVSKDVINRRGGVVVALSDALEKAGRRVEIIGHVCVGNSRASVVVDLQVRIKAAHERLNLPSLAFVFAHAAMYRRLGFSALEVHPKGNLVGGHGGYYGYAADFNAKDGAIKVPSLDYHSPFTHSGEAAEKWLVDTLTAQGVKIG